MDIKVIQDKVISYCDIGLIELNKDITNGGNYIYFSGAGKIKDKLAYKLLFKLNLVEKSISTPSSIYTEIEKLTTNVFNAYLNGEQIEIEKIVLKRNENKNLFYYEVDIYYTEYL